MKQEKEGRWRKKNKKKKNLGRGERETK